VVAPAATTSAMDTLYPHIAGRLDVVDRSAGVAGLGAGTMFLADRHVARPFTVLAQVIAVGLDDEVDRPAVRRLGLRACVTRPAR